MQMAPSSNIIVSYLLSNSSRNKGSYFIPIASAETPGLTIILAEIKGPSLDRSVWIERWEMLTARLRSHSQDRGSTSHWDLGRADTQMKSTLLYWKRGKWIAVRYANSIFVLFCLIPCINNISTDWFPYSQNNNGSPFMWWLLWALHMFLLICSSQPYVKLIL
jgi:hypothetical protein